MPVRSDVNIRRTNELRHFFRANKAVVENHLLFHSHLFRQGLQAGSVRVSFAAQNVRMRRARHHVHDMFVLRQNVGHRPYDALDAFVWRQQSERQQHRFAFHAKAVFIEIGIEKRQVRYAMRHHVNLLAGHLVDLLQKLRRELTHHNQTVGKVRNLFHDTELVRAGLAQDRVQRGHHGHLQVAQQMQDMTSRRPAENPILVLQAHHVDIVEVQELRRVPIRCQVILRQRPAHARGIVIPFGCVVHRKRQQSRRTVLSGDRSAQVRRKRRDPTLPRKIVPDHRNPTRQGWLRLRSWASDWILRDLGTRRDYFQDSSGKYCVG